MNEKQAARVTQIAPTSLWAIPPGSWLAIRRSDEGTWFEVIDPEGTATLAFDFTTDEPLRAFRREGLRS